MAAPRRPLSPATSPRDRSVRSPAPRRAIGRTAQGGRSPSRQRLRLGLALAATHLVSNERLRHGSDMALDLYQRLGLKRGASEAEITKAYRSLARQLHPDRNQDNPNAAKRFGEVTHAYDLLSDKDKRARYDRGEIDEDGNPKMPFGSGFGGYSAGAGPQPRAGAGFESFNFGGADGADLGDLFEGLFGGAGARGRAGAPFGGFRHRARAGPQKGADVAYRLKVPFVDAVALKPQRITLGDGKTVG